VGAAIQSRKEDQVVNIYERIKLEIESREHIDHFTIGELQDFPPKQIRIINMIWQRGEVGLIEMAEELDLSLSETEDLLARLVAKGYLETFQVEGEIRYHIHHAFVREHKVSANIWETLKKKVN
jgi:DNA-binding MarR family transcriptional regulator